MTTRRETLFPEITSPSKTASSELATPNMTTGRLASFLVKATLVLADGGPSEDDARSQRPLHDPEVLQHLRHPHAKHSKSPQWNQIMKDSKTSHERLDGLWEAGWPT